MIRNVPSANTILARDINSLEKVEHEDHHVDDITLQNALLTPHEQLLEPVQGGIQLGLHGWCRGYELSFYAVHCGWDSVIAWYVSQEKEFLIH